MTGRGPLPQPTQCSIGAQYALANAEAHFECAEHLAAAGHAGIACSHLVLALEEAQKAYILALYWAGLPAEGLELGRVMYQHKIRHTQAFWDTFMLANVEMIEKHLKDIDAEDATSDSGGTKREELIRRLTSEIQNITQQDPPTHPVLVAFDWIASADARKNHGFYVDFKTDWISPSDTTPADFERGRAVTRRFIDHRRLHVARVLEASDEWREELVKGHRDVRESIKLNPRNASVANVLEMAADELRRNPEKPAKMKGN
jgi:AbiV family abortive infection protein